MILINCGATEDVARLLELDTTVRIIVIDNHRPFHHNFNDPYNLDILAFCNPEDGTCSDVPDPDGFSGVPKHLSQQAKPAKPAPVSIMGSAYHRGAAFLQAS